MGRTCRTASVAGGSLLSLLTAVSSAAQTPVTAFTHVAVIPMDRERVLHDQTVVVRGDRIIALGPASRVRVPAAARRIDGRGKYLMPGLADMHAHAPGARMTFAPFLEGRGFRNEDDRREWLKAHEVAIDSGKGDADPSVGGGADEIKRILFLYVANGVTTVRIMQGFPGHLRLREQAQKGAFLSPRIYLAANSVRNNTVRVATPESEVRYVEAAKTAGYDELKIYDGWDAPVLDSAVATAHRVGLPMTGHLGATSGMESSVALERAIARGQRSIEHTDIMAAALQYTTGKNLGDYQAALLDTARIRPKLAELGQRLRQAGVWLCPTVAHDQPAVLSRRDGSAWRYLEPFTRTRLSTDSTAPVEKLSADILLLGYTLRTLYEGGARFLLGTDAFFGELPGFAVHDELAALVRLGFTPYQALETGTRNVATYTGTLDRTGTVAVGKRADLVLLSGNPLVDIVHTRQPAGVMLGGQWLSRTELDQILALLEGSLPG